MGADISADGLVDAGLEMLETAYFSVTNAKMNDHYGLVNDLARQLLLGGSAAAKTTDTSEKFHVQFNPTSIRFNDGTENGSNDGENKTSVTPSEGGPAPKAESQNPKRSQVVSMTLVFDQSSIYVRGVQDDVEEFVNAVVNPYVRNVEFFWGRQYYKGVITKVEVNYTMFNLEGIPIRANVDVSIKMFESDQKVN